MLPLARVALSEEERRAKVQSLEEASRKLEARDQERLQLTNQVLSTIQSSLITHFWDKYLIHRKIWLNMIELANYCNNLYIFLAKVFKISLTVIDTVTFLCSLQRMWHPNFLRQPHCNMGFPGGFVSVRTFLIRGRVKREKMNMIESKIACKISFSWKYQRCKTLAENFLQNLYRSVTLIPVQICKDLYRCS